MTDWTSKSEPTTGWIGEVCEITNPTFQEPLSTGWTAIGFTRSQSFGYDDSNSAVATASLLLQADRGELFSDPISVMPNRRYKLTCYFYMWPGASFSAGSNYIRIYDGSGTLVQQELPTETGSWHKIEATFTPKKTTCRIKVSFTFPQADLPDLFCAFDAFKLEEYAGWTSASQPTTTWSEG